MGAVLHVLCFLFNPRRYLKVYAEMFFSLPIKMHTGEHLSCDEVTNRLESETNEYYCRFGFEYDFSGDYNGFFNSWSSYTIGGVLKDIFNVHIQVAPSKYETAVAWMKNLLYNSEFSIERWVWQLPFHRCL